MDKGDRKRIKIALAAIAVILLAAITIIYLDKGRNGRQEGEAPIFRIEMMDQQEKAANNIGATQEVQILERTDSGDVMTYKIINSESDIVKSLSEIE